MCCVFLPLPPPLYSLSRGVPSPLSGASVSRSRSRTRRPTSIGVTSSSTSTPQPNAARRRKSPSKRTSPAPSSPAVAGTRQSSTGKREVASGGYAAAALAAAKKVLDGEPQEAPVSPLEAIAALPEDHWLRRSLTPVVAEEGAVCIYVCVSCVCIQCARVCVIVFDV